MGKKQWKERKFKYMVLEKFFPPIFFLNILISIFEPPPVAKPCTPLEDASIQVLASMAKWFLRRKKIFKFSSVYSDVRIQPSIVAASSLRGSWFKQIWIYTTWGYFQKSFSFSERMVLEDNFFNYTNKLSIIPNYLPLKQGVDLF